MDKIKIAVTTGDEDGVGLEVAIKALDKMGPQKDFQFFLFRGLFNQDIDTKILKNKFRVKFIQKEDDLLGLLHSSSDFDLVDVQSTLPAPLWVELATKCCLRGELNGLVTGPLSKPIIKQSGLLDIGHTDILKRLSGIKSVNMGFLGKYFNVVLATGHIPISEVSKQLNEASVYDSLLNAKNLLRLLSPPKKSLPMALLGLNPHAGDQGLIGSEEHLWLNESFLKRMRTENIKIEGPLSPDSAFLKNNWKNYSLYFALYHDQGLIPFKMVHHNSGAHITLGIPFIRTSVDHGTAKDLFGKNKANFNSMLESLKWCIKLTKTKRF